MVVLGVAMIPLPGPSLPTLVAGLHVLGTEFDCAKTAKETVVQVSKKALHHSKQFCQTMEEQLQYVCIACLGTRITIAATMMKEC
mmetsp:Transcript_2134/g.2417  ORF Transcript_2134/g.2417 Transcript_2134/m.2417 type:complete len:85 (-) Transcript_2134:196-450(-)